MKTKRTLMIAALGFLLLPLKPAFGEDVTPGFDLWVTEPGGAVEHFGEEAPPIPADFFGPGSDPFIGEVIFTGDPIEVFMGQPTEPADTIVERTATATLPGPGSSDSIPVQLVELSLVSTNPIMVTFKGGQNPTEFDVRVDLGAAPSNGTMTINQGTDRGGNYSAAINVCPLFTFTEVGNPTNAPTLDYCAQVDAGGRAISVTNQLWSYEAVTPLTSPLSGPNFFIRGTTQHDGPHPKADPIETALGIPATSEWGLTVLLLVILAGGTIIIGRQTRPAIA